MQLNVEIKWMEKKKSKLNIFVDIFQVFFFYARNLL